MAQEPGEGKVPLNHSRQETIDALMEHFANDVMDVDEFERRVGIAHQAQSSGQLRELLADLPGGGLPVPVQDTPSTSPATLESTGTLPAHRSETEYVVALLGGSSRRGRWTPARKNYVVAIMGGAELDFREARLAPGVTELQVYTMWGGVEVIVPPGVNVESHGIALLGGFEHAAGGGSSEVPSPDAPTLRITGVALMAGVDISVRHPGETARDARRRRRQERREQRRRLKGG